MKWLAKGIGIALGISVVVSVFMLLWNLIMPGIFSLPFINFWQSLGLLVMVKILFNKVEIK